MEYEIKINVNGDKNELEGLEIPYKEIVELLQVSYSKNIFGTFSYVGEARAVDPNQMSFFISLGANATFALVVWLVKKIYVLLKKHPKFQCWVSIDIDNKNVKDGSLFIFDNTKWEQVYDELYSMKNDIEYKIVQEKELDDKEIYDEE